MPMLSYSAPQFMPAAGDINATAQPQYIGPPVSVDGRYLGPPPSAPPVNGRYLGPPPRSDGSVYANSTPPAGDNERYVGPPQYGAPPHGVRGLPSPPPGAWYDAQGQGNMPGQRPGTRPASPPAWVQDPDPVRKMGGRKHPYAQDNRPQPVTPEGTDNRYLGAFLPPQGGGGGFVGGQGQVGPVDRAQIRQILQGLFSRTRPGAMSGWGGDVTDGQYGAPGPSPFYAGQGGAVPSQATTYDYSYPFQPQFGGALAQLPTLDYGFVRPQRGGAPLQQQQQYPSLYSLMGLG